MVRVCQPCARPTVWLVEPWAVMAAISLLSVVHCAVVQVAGNGVTVVAGQLSSLAAGKFVAVELGAVLVVS